MNKLPMRYEPNLEAIIERISQSGLMVIKFELPIVNVFKNYTLNSSVLLLEAFNENTFY